MIDAGMRAGIPTSEHGSVVTVYGNTREIMENLKISDSSIAYAFLLDHEGIVRLAGDGHAKTAGRSKTCSRVHAVLPGKSVENKF